LALTSRLARARCSQSIINLAIAIVVFFVAFFGLWDLLKHARRPTLTIFETKSLPLSTQSFIGRFLWSIVAIFRCTRCTHSLNAQLFQARLCRKTISLFSATNHTLTGTADHAFGALSIFLASRRWRRRTTNEAPKEKKEQEQQAKKTEATHHYSEQHGFTLV
jgi:hypothetical protein